MRIERIELRRVGMTLARPFRTAHGVTTDRDVVVVRVTTDAAEGWGECVALPEPTYTSEYVEGAFAVLERFLARLLLTAPDDLGGSDVGSLLAAVKGHPMAKAALELAVVDAELRERGESLANRLGAVRPAVEAGVAVGITADLDALVAEVQAAVTAGYRRVKLKIQPGWDLRPVRAVRSAFPDLALHVDANGVYRIDDADHLAGLDELGLLMIEQPLADDDLLGHAELARRLATPICLDETITSANVAATVLDLGACSIVNVKPGRVGGLLEALRIHDLCVDRSVDLWCGGMLETGIGRAANVALAALPGFTLPGDLSASDRYWTEDLTEPFTLDDGRLGVPTGPGIGVAPRPHLLDQRTRRVVELRR